VLSPVLTPVLTLVLTPVLRTVLTPVLSFLSSDPVGAGQVIPTPTCTCQLVPKELHPLRSLVSSVLGYFVFFKTE